jgi:hypothetical protein
MRHHKIKGVTHQINHAVRIFYNHSMISHAIVALRNPAISHIFFASKEMWYLNGITS